VDLKFFALACAWVAAVASSDAKSAEIASAPQHPTFGHIVVIVEENTGLGYLLGNKKDAPFFNSLVNEYGLATEFYANTHPSIGNYMMLVTGQVLTNDDRETPASFPVSADNVVRRLMQAGKSWKAYAEGLPQVGYTGGNTHRYAVRHVPIAYLTDVQYSPEARSNLVPFTQFTEDLNAHRLPQYSFVTPDLCNDAHDCRVDLMDRWLAAHVPRLLADAQFKKDGLLIITFDEAWGSDDAHGGGQIATVLISPAFSKRGYRSTTFYQHQSTLRLALEGLGIDVLPGLSKDAPSMWEFFEVAP
jgi:phosphatidylinositol-3-phosphatase